MATKPKNTGTKIAKKTKREKIDAPEAALDRATKKENGQSTRRRKYVDEDDFRQ